jgi:DNA polymerase-3 subunit gamma/tau
MLGTAGSERLYGVVSALASHDTAGVLRELDRAVGDGVDAGQLTEQLLGCLRDLLALSVGGGKELLLHSPESDAEELTEVAEKWGTQNLLAAAQIVDQALTRMRMVTHSRVLLEMALIRIANQEDLSDLSDLIHQVRSGEAPAGDSKKKTPPVAEAKTDGEQKTGKIAARRPAAGVAAGRPEHPVQRAPMARGRHHSDDSDRPVAPSPDSIEDHEIPSDADVIWREAIDQLEGMAADCASHFADAANSAPNRLVVTFSSMYTSSKSFCERPERHGEMERIVSKIAGKRLKLEFALRADKGHDNPEEPAISARQREREITQRPFVQRAAELFSANITGVTSPKRSDD